MDKEKKAEFKKMLSDLKEIRKQDRINNEFLKGFAIPAGRILGIVPKPVRRKRTDTPMTGSEKQKRFNERMIAAGFRRIRLWVKDERPHPDREYIGLLVHKKIPGIGKTNPGIQGYLDEVMSFLTSKKLNEKYNQLAEVKHIETAISSLLRVFYSG